MRLNKFFTRIFTVFFFFTTLSICGALPTQKAKAADLPVQLYYSQRIEDNQYGAGHVEGYIAVQNLSYDKKVTVHYTSDGGKSWNDVPATYLKTNPSDNYEVWKFATPLNPEIANPITFCIKYEVNGQTYWDNNGGNNYTDSAFGKSYLCADAGGSYFDGTNKVFLTNITTEDMPGTKIVKVRYTEDNWATYTDSDASEFNSSPYDNSPLKHWLLKEILKPSTTQVQFSVLYEVNGVQYWDNNFGSNYTINY